MGFSPSSSSGAYGINARYEAGQSSVWYISQQEEGADAIARGIATGNTTYIDDGIRTFDWGFAHQQPNGSFEPQYDIPASQVITINFFVSAVARGCLLLQQSNYAAQYAASCNAYKPKLQQALTWTGGEPQYSGWVRHITNQTGYGTFLHQEYEYASAVGLVYKFTGDSRYMSTAYERIQSANSRQDPAGWNMEINGYDTGYGSLGMRAADYWITYLPDDPMTPGLKAMMSKAMPWYASRIESNGHINSSGNTRTCVYNGGDQGKNPGYSTLIWDFGFWGLYSDNATYTNTSARVNDFNNLIRQGQAQPCP
jgi:hypothetical protein